MVKTFDNEIKSTRKYARALTAITAVFVVLVVGFVIYSGVYFNTKSRLEGNFAEQLKENNFYKNRDGYYSMDYANGVVYGVPNQSMPSLLEFSLQFHLSNLYCDIDLEDTTVEIVWEDNNQFSASAVSKTDNKIIGSTSEFKENDFTDMQKLSDELGIPEKEIGKIIDKGNELYNDFYSK